ncbi:MAG: HEAT repeat domain-containing protein [Verrucomicrobiia bacterium]
MKYSNPINRFLLILVLAAICLSAAQVAQSKEPYYDGKPLSDWLLARPDAEQQNAISQMGTNAIPTLIDILGATERTAKKVTARLGSKGLQQFVRTDDFKIEEFQAYAVRGFVILGTNAEPAIPQLVILLKNENTSFNAAQALAVVGPKGFATLTNSTSSPTRDSTMFALAEKSDGDPKAVTQLLINALNDESPGIRANAADLLRDRDPNMAIPALTKALDDKSSSVRWWAASALGNYGAAAKGASEKIFAIYTNAPDQLIFDALGKVDPETAGKAYAFLFNAPLGIAGFGWTTSRLPNGKDLIAGGKIYTRVPTPSHHVFSRAQLYDSNTGKRIETGEMNTARFFHTATLLRSGKVLVAGGEDAENKALSSAELYDTATGKWTETGLMNKPHYDAKAALQKDGTVLVFSKTYRSPISYAERYDPTTEKWVVITNLTGIQE